MKKINRFLLVYLVIVTVLCGYMCYVAFYQVEPNQKLVDQVQTKIVKDKEKKKSNKVTTYVLAIQNKEVVVLNAKTKKVFEYTDLNENHLPVEIQKMLNNKTLFYGPEDVYHFLESYSS